MMPPETVVTPVAVTSTTVSPGTMRPIRTLVSSAIATVAMSTRNPRINPGDRVENPVECVVQPAHDPQPTGPRDLGHIRNPPARGRLE